MIRGKSEIMITGYLILVCFVLLCGGTAAYLTNSDTAHNHFVTGSQISEISESWNPPESFAKDQSYEKKVMVKNTGTADCYVRVFAEIEDAEMADAVSVDWNADSWTAKQADGYYYYRDKLSPGEKTEPLFTALTATADLTDFKMIVYEESVQAAGSVSAVQAFEF